MRILFGIQIKLLFAGDRAKVNFPSVIFGYDLGLGLVHAHAANRILGHVVWAI